MRSIVLASWFVVPIACTSQPAIAPATSEPVEEGVTIFRSAPSGAFQVLGDVQASAMVEIVDDNVPEVLLASLRADATKLGANGVLIENVETTSFAVKGRDGAVQVISGVSRGIPTVVTAKAIRVPATK